MNAHMMAATLFAGSLFALFVKPICANEAADVVLANNARTAVLLDLEKADATIKELKGAYSPDTKEDARVVIDLIRINKEAGHETYWLAEILLSETAPITENQELLDQLRLLFIPQMKSVSPHSQLGAGWRDRLAVSALLASIGESSYIRYLREGLYYDGGLIDERVKWYALRCLVQVDAEEAVDLVIEWMGENGWGIEDTITLLDHILEHKPPRAREFIGRMPQYGLADSADMDMVIIGRMISVLDFGGHIEDVNWLTKLRNASRDYYGHDDGVRIERLIDRVVQGILDRNDD